jgi:hypothetical protein
MWNCNTATTTNAHACSQYVIHSKKDGECIACAKGDWLVTKEECSKEAGGSLQRMPMSVLHQNHLRPVLDILFCVLVK